MSLRLVEGFETFGATVGDLAGTGLNRRYSNFYGLSLSNYASSMQLAAGRNGGYSVKGCNSNYQYFYHVVAADDVPTNDTWIIGVAVRFDSSYPDENAVVVSANMLRDEPDVRLGDEIVLKIDGREREWRVVGVSMGFLLPMVYGNYPHVAHLTGQFGEADTALVSLVSHDPAYVEGAAVELEAHFERSGMRVTNAHTLAAERAEAEIVYGVVVTLMLIMAALLAVVGGLGLMGTMSINVLERTREIGVLRAIGAPNRGVSQVFIREGIVIGVLSWLLGSLLSVPLSRGLCNAVGMPLAGTPLTFSFSPTGVWVWLAVVVALSALASLVPARNASRMTVREVLAYE